MAIKLGNNSVSLHLGSDEVKEMYLGNVKIYEKAQSSYTLTLTASGSWNNHTYYEAKITLRKENSSGEIVAQYSNDTLAKNTFPKVITNLPTGTYYLEAENGGGFMGNGFSSTDYSLTDLTSWDYTIVSFTLDKSGTIDLNCDDWND